MSMIDRLHAGCVLAKICIFILTTQIGVHIADVTHYVTADSALDREAAERCTTVYLVNQRTDMLPKVLSTGLCSLKSGFDRLAFSCFWEMTPSAEIVHTRFYKTVMHAVAAFNYKQAQDLIDDKKDKSVNTEQTTFISERMYAWILECL